MARYHSFPSRSRVNLRGLEPRCSGTPPTWLPSGMNVPPVTSPTTRRTHSLQDFPDHRLMVLICPRHWRGIVLCLRQNVPLSGRAAGERRSIDHHDIPPQRTHKRWYIRSVRTKYGPRGYVNRFRYVPYVCIGGCHQFLNQPTALDPAEA